VVVGGGGKEAVRRARAKNWLTDVATATILPHLCPHELDRHEFIASRPSDCPELDCVRHLLPSRILTAAEHRARSIGVGADRVLICADAITEEAYLTALAGTLGTSYERFDEISRADCPLDDDQLVQAAAAGLVPLREGRGLVWIIAPPGITARRLADPRQQRPAWLQSFRLTSADRLRQFALQHSRRALGRDAAESLRQHRPLLSNAPPEGGRPGLRAASLTAIALLFFTLAPLPVIEGVSGVCCVLFLAAANLRLLSACFDETATGSSAHHADRELPIYTIICALYREAAVVRELVGAIRALDYPPEKLDVKFVLEPDDQETRRVLLDLNLGPPFEIILAPPIGPRTKPKALNVALPLARGAYTVVFDAEDKPEPDQLRRALDAFREGGKRLACVQGSLAIDNTADNWLTGMFTANYAGHFDVLLRGLAALGLPFPLGGSSNHFRTAVLRKVGGWDPYNVTEDADLGIRLYRLGYRSAAIASTTYEEAPARFVPWLRQRTRWYKGWMQTWLVHMRQPGRLFRELTPAGAIAFQIFFAANMVSALIHPLFMTGLGVTLYELPKPWAKTVMENAAPIFVTSLLSGYASTIVLDLIGLGRRGLLGSAWVLVLTPLHWLLLSLAAWRALFQLIYDPQRWEKTEHGMAATSRVARSQQRPKTPVNKPRQEAVVGRLAVPPVDRIGPSMPIAPMKIMETSRGALLAR
jgi:cellulose synthase/poly-beta-1,6-N-acetylglucosamine synthase-like glycosyltransferase